MSGVKGRSGGARPNTAGKPQPTSVPGSKDPVAFLLSVMNDQNADGRLRVRAAGLAAQYVAVKRHDGGKKDERERAAERVAAGRFKASSAPRLVVNNK
jgi:phage terminase small subunit